jgi:hypothetical protein
MRHRHLRKDYGALSELIAIGGAGGGDFPSPVVPNPSWLQANWYVNPVTGSDSASGTSPATAVKTIMGGIVARWGTTEPILKQSTTIFLLAAETLNQEAIVLAPVMVFGTVFGLVGTPTPIASFALGVVTPKNRSTPQLLTAAGFTAAGLAVGQIVVNITRGNSHAIIENLAGGVATLSQPLQPLTIADAASFPPPLPEEVDTWATTDAVAVIAPLLINIKEYNPRGGDTTDGTHGGNWWMQGVHIADTSGTDGNSTLTMGSTDCLGYVIDSYVSPFLIIGQIGAEGVDSNYVVGCYCGGGVSIQYGQVVGGVVALFGLGFGPYGGVDGDAICITIDCFDAPCFVGMAYVQTGTLQVGNNGMLKLDPINSVTPTYSAFLWGPAGLDVADNGYFENTTGVSYVTRVLLKGALTINGNATGTSYAAGVWTDGIAVTQANIDAHDGLQNPRTGAKYYNAAG